MHSLGASTQAGGARSLQNIEGQEVSAAPVEPVGPSGAPQELEEQKHALREREFVQHLQQLQAKEYQVLLQKQSMVNQLISMNIHQKSGFKNRFHANPSASLHHQSFLA